MTTMATQTAVRNVGRLSAQKTAIFLCDMQEKFSKTIQYFPQIVAVSQRLLKAGRALDMTVIVTEQYPKGLGRTVPELGLEEFPDIKPIEKTQFSMMTAEVTKQMQEKGLDSVVLCGIETHVCVQNTALALLERGFNVHIAVDACSSRTMVDRFFGFERMKASGAWLTTSESVILSLLGGSSHPKFKEVQKLIMESAPDSGLLGFTQKHTSAL
uniref:Isochorismatase-like domain-containing protein n=1 Tax=Amblyomma maculatum TaxID=34609 RepID=G3MQ24_AMBMU